MQRGQSSARPSLDDTLQLVSRRGRVVAVRSQAAANGTVTPSSSSFCLLDGSIRRTLCRRGKVREVPAQYAGQLHGQATKEAWHQRLRPLTVNGPAPHRVQPPPAESERIRKRGRPRTPCCGPEDFAELSESNQYRARWIHRNTRPTTRLCPVRGHDSGITSVSELPLSQLGSNTAPRATL
jgi:hypothetical protein